EVRLPEPTKPEPKVAEPKPKLPPEQEALAAIEMPFEPKAVGETRKHLDIWEEKWKEIKAEDLAKKRARVEKEAKRKVTKEWKQNEILTKEEARNDVEKLPEVRLAELLRSGTFAGDTLEGG